MKRLLTAIVCLLAFIEKPVSGKSCQFPEYFLGDYYSEQKGGDIYTSITKDSWTEQGFSEYTCVEMERISKNDTHIESAIKNKNAYKIIVKTRTGGACVDCYRCFWVFGRTVNIIQVRIPSTGSSSASMSICNVFPPSSALITMYSKNIEKVNCKETFEGVYQFSYEIEEGGGICHHESSKIEACQLPGSTYVENNVVDFTYMKCPEVSTSLNANIRYLCMGHWDGDDGYKYAALAKTVEKVDKERYSCLLTRADQRPTNNIFRWTKTRFTECNKLISTYRGYQKLLVKPVPPLTKDMIPKCNLPRNISGEWFTMGTYETRVTINETHIYFKTKLSEFQFRETYYSCQQTYGTRYMMTSVTIGQCEVNYVCFDLMPRHHSIVRYRIAKPYRGSQENLGSNQQSDEFRSTCNWLRFTANRDQTKWKYQVLILDPPTPVPCPIAGRYYFSQYPANTIKSIIRGGQTETPRMQVQCFNKVSAMSSCSRDMTQVELDVDYCETVDYKGRPIGEYDEPDIVMSCVGYWMEDMKSYLITYDELDEQSRFRCWVYKRLSWTEIVMSRNSRARCDPEQEATSKIEGRVDLSLELSEQERLFDMCPQRFADGYDPYKKPLELFVLASTSSISYHIVSCFIPISILCLIL